MLVLRVNTNPDSNAIIIGDSIIISLLKFREGKASVRLKVPPGIPVSLLTPAFPYPLDLTSDEPFSCLLDVEEMFHIGEKIDVMLTGINAEEHFVKFGIQAPREIKAYRIELLKKMREGNIARGKERY